MLSLVGTGDLVLTRLHLDSAIAGLALVVTLYYKIPSDKRAAFERSYPRVAAFIGFLAALVPFIPALVATAKSIVTGSPVTQSVPSIYPPANNADNSNPNDMGVNHAEEEVSRQDQ